MADPVKVLAIALLLNLSYSQNVGHFTQMSQDFRSSLQQIDSSLLSQIENHGCWCKRFNSDISSWTRAQWMETGGDYTAEETDKACKDMFSHRRCPCTTLDGACNMISQTTNLADLNSEGIDVQRIYTDALTSAPEDIYTACSNAISGTVNHPNILQKCKAQVCAVDIYWAKYISEVVTASSFTSVDQPPGTCTHVSDAHSPGTMTQPMSCSGNGPVFQLDKFPARAMTVDLRNNLENATTHNTLQWTWDSGTFSQSILDAGLVFQDYVGSHYESEDWDSQVHVWRRRRRRKRQSSTWSTFDYRTDANIPTECKTLANSHQPDSGKCMASWAFAATSVAQDSMCVHSYKDNSNSHDTYTAANATLQAKNTGYFQHHRYQSIHNNALSPRDLLECCDTCFARQNKTHIGKCMGGFSGRAGQYIETNGIALESARSYSGSDFETYGSGIFWEKSSASQCQGGLNRHGADSVGIKRIWRNPTLDYASTQTWLQEWGTLVMRMQVYEDFFFYQSGVYQYQYGLYVGMIDVRVIGYGNDGTNNYWLCQNSWGTSWGDSGTFKIKAGDAGVGSEDLQFWSYEYECHLDEIINTNGQCWAPLPTPDPVCDGTAGSSSEFHIIDSRHNNLCNDGTTDNTNCFITPHILNHIEVTHGFCRTSADDGNTVHVNFYNEHTSDQMEVYELPSSGPVSKGTVGTTTGHLAEVNNPYTYTRNGFLETKTKSVFAYKSETHNGGYKYEAYVVIPTAFAANKYYAFLRKNDGFPASLSAYESHICNHLTLNCRHTTLNDNQNRNHDNSAVLFDGWVDSAHHTNQGGLEDPFKARCLVDTQLCRSTSSGSTQTYFRFQNDYTETVRIERIGTDGLEESNGFDVHTNSVYDFSTYLSYMGRQYTVRKIDNTVIGIINTPSVFQSSDNDQIMVSVKLYDPAGTGFTFTGESFPNINCLGTTTTYNWEKDLAGRTTELTQAEMQMLLESKHCRTNVDTTTIQIRIDSNYPGTVTLLDSTGAETSTTHDFAIGQASSGTYFSILAGTAFVVRDSSGNLVQILNTGRVANNLDNYILYLPSTNPQKDIETHVERGGACQGDSGDDTLIYRATNRLFAGQYTQTDLNGMRDQNVCYSANATTATNAVKMVFRNLDSSTVSIKHISHDNSNVDVTSGLSGSNSIVNTNVHFWDGVGGYVYRTEDASSNTEAFFYGSHTTTAGDYIYVKRFSSTSYLIRSLPAINCQTTFIDQSHVSDDFTNFELLYETQQCRSGSTSVNIHLRIINTHNFNVNVYYLDSNGIIGNLLGSIPPSSSSNNYLDYVDDVDANSAFLVRDADSTLAVVNMFGLSQTAHSLAENHHYTVTLQNNGGASSISATVRDAECRGESNNLEEVSTDQYSADDMITITHTDNRVCETTTGGNGPFTLRFRSYTSSRPLSIHLIATDGQIGTVIDNISDGVVDISATTGQAYALKDTSDAYQAIFNSPLTQSYEYVLVRIDDPNDVSENFHIDAVDAMSCTLNSIQSMYYYPAATGTNAEMKDLQLEARLCASSGSSNTVNFKILNNYASTIYIDTLDAQGDESHELAQTISSSTASTGIGTSENGWFTTNVHAGDVVLVRAGSSSGEILSWIKLSNSAATGDNFYVTIASTGLVDTTSLRTVDFPSMDCDPTIDNIVELDSADVSNMDEISASGRCYARSGSFSNLRLRVYNDHSSPLTLIQQTTSGSDSATEYAINQGGFQELSGTSYAASPFKVLLNGVNDHIFTTPTTAVETNFLVTKPQSGSYSVIRYAGNECAHAGLATNIEYQTIASNVYRMGLCQSNADGSQIRVNFINRRSTQISVTALNANGDPTGSAFTISGSSCGVFEYGTTCEMLSSWQTVNSGIMYIVADNNGDYIGRVATLSSNSNIDQVNTVVIDETEASSENIVFDAINCSPATDGSIVFTGGSDSSMATSTLADIARVSYCRQQTGSSLALNARLYNEGTTATLHKFDIYGRYDSTTFETINQNAYATVTDAACPYLTKFGGNVENIFTTPSAASSPNILITRESSGSYRTAAFADNICEADTVGIDYTPNGDARDILRLGMCESTNGVDITTKIYNAFGSSITITRLDSNGDETGSPVSLSDSGCSYSVTGNNCQVYESTSTDAGWKFVVKDSANDPIGFITTSSSSSAGETNAIIIHGGYTTSDRLAATFSCYDTSNIYAVTDSATLLQNMKFGLCGPSSSATSGHTIKMKNTAGNDITVYSVDDTGRQGSLATISTGVITEISTSAGLSAGTAYYVTGSSNSMFSLPTSIPQNRALVTFDGSTYNYANIANYECDGSGSDRIFNQNILSTTYSSVVNIGSMSQHALDYKLCKSGSSTSFFGAGRTFIVNHSLSNPSLKLKLLDGAGDIVQEFDVTSGSTNIADTSQIRYDSAFVVTDAAGTRAYSTFNIRQSGVTSDRNLVVTIDSSNDVTGIAYST